MLLLLALSAGALAQKEDAPEREADDDGAVEQGRADDKQEPRREDAADETFRPSERIDADTAVRFPADI